MILENKIKCNKCGDIIISENVHDFKQCSCKNCAVDGGFTYLKRCGDDWTEMSVTHEFEWEKIASNLYDKFEYGKENTISVDQKDLSILLSNLNRCALGWAYTAYHLKKLKKQEEA